MAKSPTPINPTARYLQETKDTLYSLLKNEQIFKVLSAAMRMKIMGLYDQADALLQDTGPAPTTTEVSRPRIDSFAVES